MGPLKPTVRLGARQARILLILAEPGGWLQCWGPLAGTPAYEVPDALGALERRGLVSSRRGPRGMQWTTTAEAAIAVAEQRVLIAQKALDRAYEELLEASRSTAAPTGLHSLGLI